LSHSLCTSGPSLRLLSEKQRITRGCTQSRYCRSRTKSHAACNCRKANMADTKPCSHFMSSGF
jgi:hypothetical protein